MSKFLSVHLCIDSRSFCIYVSRDVGSFPVIQIVPSSANLILSDFVWENMSLMNTLNRMGEITKNWYDKRQHQY
jgi:hypothetical protein